MRVFNRRARRDYEIIDTWEAGVKLTGPEVKSVKEGSINLEHAYVKVEDGEAFLINAHIKPYTPAGRGNITPDRTRRLLLHRKEAVAIETKANSGRLTVIPVSCYTKHGLIKVKLGVARGKKRWEKREDLKKKAIERDIERELAQR